MGENQVPGGAQDLKPQGQGQPRLELAVLPLVTHPVDRPLASCADRRTPPRWTAPGPAQMMSYVDQFAGSSVWPYRGRAQVDHLVYLVPRLDLFLVSHLRADHGLDQPVDLQRLLAWSTLIRANRLISRITRPSINFSLSVSSNGSKDSFISSL